MFWVQVWWWLQENNLIKAVVAWSVGLLLNSVWAVRLWVNKKRRDREAQAALLDRLDTSTPGGLGEIKRLISGEPEPDDNGSDLAEDGHRREPDKDGRSSGMWPDIMRESKGGSGAGHR